MTVAFNEDNFFNASIAFSALYSSMKPRTAIRMMIIRMTMASMYSFRKAEISVAAINIQSTTLLNWLRKIFHGGIFFDSFISFKPYCLSLCSASWSERPLFEVFSSFNACSVDLLCISEIIILAHIILFRLRFHFLHFDYEIFEAVKAAEACFFLEIIRAKYHSIIA